MNYTPPCKRNATHLFISFVYQFFVLIQNQITYVECSDFSENDTVFVFSVRSIIFKWLIFKKLWSQKKKSQKCIRGGKSWGEKCCNFQQLMRRAACLVSIRCELRVKNSSQHFETDVFDNGVNQYHSTHSASLTRVRRTCRWTTTKTQRCVTGRKST